MYDLYFLGLHGVRGESFAPRHIGEIELSDIQWGGGPTRRASAGAGGGPGSVTFKEVSITKSRDSVSPVLFSASHAGRHFREAVLTLEKVDRRGHLVRSIIFQLRSVLIDSVSQSNGHEEIVTLSFDGLRMRQA
ncbi:MAG TPA: type VI secretion system tube protein Hcp [Pyrinomonadaceae bacterium]|nr:type VI secretion system tube protein Hcp [Pyrinomonadaceae bacterium]